MNFLEMEFQALGKIENIPNLGKSVVSSRKILKGETILKELPAFVGPFNFEDYIPICLACYKQVPSSFKCTKCQWPICGNACEKDLAHSQECEIFFRKGISHEGMNEEYSCVVTLRSLLQRNNLDRLLKYESHSEHRKNDPETENIVNFAIHFIRGLCGLEEFQEEIIRHALCAIKTNGVWPFPEIDRLVVLLFDKMSYFAHGCDPNTDFKVVEYTDGAMGVEIHANQEIEEGDVITIRYCDLEMKVKDRRQFLWDWFYFHCSCARCIKELSELGNHG